MNTTCFVDTHDFNEESIIIGDGGEPNINYGTVFSTSDHCYVLKSSNCNIKYIYYYLYNNLNIMEKLYTGVAIKNISKTKIRSIKISIPPLEKQKEIVEYCDFIYDKCLKTSNEKINELKKLNEFCLNNQKSFGDNEIKKLGDLCDINPENMTTGMYTEINYIDISSVNNGKLLDIKKLTNNFPSRAKRIVKKGDILYSTVRPNLKGYIYINNNINNFKNIIGSTGFAHIRIKNNCSLMSKYLYYIITCDNITKLLISKAKGAQYPAVSTSEFKSIKIPIPSLDRQKEIVEYCEKNDALIEQLENEIKQNKEQASLFMKNILK